MRADPSDLECFVQRTTSMKDWHRYRRIPLRSLARRLGKCSRCSWGSRSGHQDENHGPEFPEGERPITACNTEIPSGPGTRLHGIHCGSSDGCNSPSSALYSPGPYLPKLPITTQLQTPLGELPMPASACA